MKLNILKWQWGDWVASYSWCQVLLEETADFPPSTPGSNPTPPLLEVTNEDKYVTTAETVTVSMNSYTGHAVCNTYVSCNSSADSISIWFAWPMPRLHQGNTSNVEGNNTDQWYNTEKNRNLPKGILVHWILHREQIKTLCGSIQT